MEPENPPAPEAIEKPKKKKKNKQNKAEEFLPPGLDKEREKAKGYDPRDVQTLFRTLSRNH